MKKYSKIGWGLLLVTALTLTGCGGKKNQNQTGQNVPKTSQNENAQENTGPSTAEKVQQKLLDWLTAGTGAKCLVEDPQMGQVTMYASGEKAKVEGFSFTPMPSPDPMKNNQSPTEEKGTMLNDGQWVYMWSGKSGIKFNIEEMKKLAEESGASQENQNQQEAMDWKNWAKKMDERGVKYNCSSTVLSDSDFAPPTDVQFQDWGEMMRKLMKMSEEMKKKMPDTPPVPTP